MPIFAKWLRLSEGHLVERGLMPEMGEAIWVEPPGDGGETVLIERNEDGVFIHQHYRTLQLTGSRGVFHKHVRPRKVMQK